MDNYYHFDSNEVHYFPPTGQNLIRLGGPNLARSYLQPRNLLVLGNFLFSLQGQLLLILLAGLFQALILPLLLKFLETDARPSVSTAATIITTTTSTTTRILSSTIPTTAPPEEPMREQIMGFFVCDEGTTCQEQTSFFSLSYDASECISLCEEMLALEGLTLTQIVIDQNSEGPCQCYPTGCTIEELDGPIRVYSTTTAEFCD